jgi:hypothetical protein
MHRTNIYLTDPQRAVLRRLAKTTGLTVAELIRRAIDAFLKQGARGAALLLLAVMSVVGCGSPTEPQPFTDQPTPFTDPIQLSIHVGGNNSQKSLVGVLVSVGLINPTRTTDTKTTDSEGVAGPWLMERGHMIDTIYIQGRAVAVCCIPAAEGQMSVSIPD